MLGDDRPRGRRLRAVRRRAAGRLPRVRPRRAGLPHRRGAPRQAGGADPQRTDRPLRRKAKERERLHPDGTFLEADRKYPGHVFNTTCLIGPDGLLFKYRKVNPWIPWEVHASPHDLPGYTEPLFPVADTEIGKIGCAICYDWLFPEAMRELALNGAEVLVRVSAYMDPWGATPPMDWWTVVNRCRALENMAFVVAANQGASLSNYPPFSWPGGSMVVDFDGRILAQADPGPGEKIVVAPLDIAALPEERQAPPRPSHARPPADRDVRRVPAADVPGRARERGGPA